MPPLDDLIATAKLEFPFDIYGDLWAEVLDNSVPHST